MATVLLEIGVEEMPAGYMPPALAQLADLARARLQAERIAYENLHTWGTPRRITLYVTGVVEHQAPAVREMRGPAVSDAFATNGEPTQAAIGFARSQGVSVNDLRIRKIDVTEYVVAVFRDEGRPTIEMLPAICTQLITGLTFPRTMRWGSNDFRFARPIRWIVALQDEDVIPLMVGDVTSGRLTRGHRFLAPGEIEIPAAKDYLRLMDENQVIVNQHTRREAIREQLAAIVQEDGAVILDDGSLLDDTTFRLEYPTAVRGAVDERSLSLPDEVLLHVLRREQNYFPLVDADGKLLPGFITVRNGDKSYLGSVREGYERVARAKLLDALFFYEQDSQQPLQDRVTALHGMVFQEQLGTMFDKVKRVETLAGLLAAWIGFSPEDRQFVERAAYLAKADLATAMVNEYPDLRGIMGMIYARRSGEPDAVADAIGEQYRPRTMDDAIPSTPLGRVLALADKVDTVVSCLAVGLSSDGTEDHFGIHRDAMGAIRLLIEGNIPLTFSQLITRALRHVPGELARPREEMQSELERLFHGYVREYLAVRGMTPEIIAAVMKSQGDAPACVWQLATFLQANVASPTLQAVARMAQRLANTARNATGDEVNPDLLTMPVERDLLTQYDQLAPRLQAAASQGEYGDVLVGLSLLIPLIERFFAEVTVMADDVARPARLALLRRLATLFNLLGDLAFLDQ